MAVETHPMQTNKFIKPSRGIGYKRVKAINREIVFGILVLLGLLYGFPFYWAIITALKTDVDVSEYVRAAVAANDGGLGTFHAADDYSLFLDAENPDPGRDHDRYQRIMRENQ